MPPTSHRVDKPKSKRRGASGGENPFGDDDDEDEESASDDSDDDDDDDDSPRRGRTKTLDLFCTNLNKAAKAGRIDPLIGRTAEIERLLTVLSRRRKNNPLLVGEPGRGRRALRGGGGRMTYFPAGSGCSFRISSGVYIAVRPLLASRTFLTWAAETGGRLLPQDWRT